MRLLKKLIKYFKGETKYVYVPDYRGRVIYSRFFFEPKSGMQARMENGTYVAFTNNNNTKIEVVVYEYISKIRKKRNDKQKRTGSR